MRTAITLTLLLLASVASAQPSTYPEVQRFILRDARVALKAATANKVFRLSTAEKKGIDGMTGTKSVKFTVDVKLTPQEVYQQWQAQQRTVIAALAQKIGTATALGALPPTKVTLKEGLWQTPDSMGGPAQNANELPIRARFTKPGEIVLEVLVEN